MRKTCSVEGCENLAQGRGWCHGHYKRWQLGKVVDGPLRHGPQPKPECKMPNCSQPAQGQGLCGKHYQRFRMHGDPSILLRISPLDTEAERFWRWVTPSERDECWLWEGSISPFGARNCGGYGYVSDEYAHRMAYRLMKGPIPENTEIDHVCHNRDVTCPGGGRLCLHRRCVNPFHLEAVSRAENARRRRFRQTHCKRGHPFDEGNTYYPARGGRRCRTCHAAIEARRRQTLNS